MYYVPGTFAGVGDTAENNIQLCSLPILMELTFEWGAAAVTVIRKWMGGTTVVIMAEHRYLVLSLLGT